jgi:hypothetical protein
MAISRSPSRSPLRIPLGIRILTLAAALLLGACAVTTHVVPLNSAVQYPPTQHVEVLLQKPERPHVEIALLESRGDSEAELLNAAREKAKTLGADAIVRLETQRVYHPPVAVYDPWYDPFYSGFRHFRPYGYYPDPWGPYRVVGGGYSYVLKSMAVKFTGSAG